MDTDSQYSALAEKEVYDSLRSEKRQLWELLWSKDFHDSVTADACSNFFPRMCRAKHKKIKFRNPSSQFQNPPDTPLLSPTSLHTQLLDPSFKQNMFRYPKHIR